MTPFSLEWEEIVGKHRKSWKKAVSRKKMGFGWGNLHPCWEKHLSQVISHSHTRVRIQFFRSTCESGSSSKAESGPLDKYFGRTTEVSSSEVYLRKRFTRQFESTHVCVWTRTTNIMCSWLFDWRYYPIYNMLPTSRLRLWAHCNAQCEEEDILVSLLAGPVGDKLLQGVHRLQAHLSKYSLESHGYKNSKEHTGTFRVPVPI